MKRWLMSIFFLALPLVSQAQDQMAIRFTHEGILAIMRSALQYNQRGLARTGFVIPAGTYSFKVKRQDISSNPVVQILTQISNVNLIRDYPFYVHNSAISANGRIDESSLRTAVSNYNAAGFDVRISFNINSLQVGIPEISMCETKRGNACGPGLKASFRGSSLSLGRGAPIRLAADFHVTVNNQQARIRLVRASSNLGTRGGPQVNINPGTLTIPPIAITVNGQTAQLDTSAVRGELLRYTGFLANKLLSFAADFVAEDLATMVNKALRNQCVPTQMNVLNIDNRARPGTPLVTAVNPRANFMALIQQDIAQIIKSARFDLALKSISTPGNTNIDLRANGSLRLNGNRWNVGNTLGNSARTLPALSLDAASRAQDHFTLALAEPTVNSALALLGGSGVFQKLVDAHVDTGGLYVNSVRTHFASNPDRFYVVVNLKLKLREVKSSTWTEWVKNRIAVWLESDNNNAELNFPLQFEVIPRLVTVPMGAQRIPYTGLNLHVNSPFTSNQLLRNSFRYANNVDRAHESVRNAIIEKLRASMGGYINRDFAVPLPTYLNMRGLALTAKSIRMIDSAYLTFGLNIDSLDLAALNRQGAGSCR